MNVTFNKTVQENSMESETRTQQIERLKRQVPKAEQPYIEPAFNFIEKRGRITLYQEREILRLVAERGARFSFPEASILADEIVKIILPRVIEIRRELWGSDEPPFPDNPAAAFRWLEKRAEEERRPIVLRREKNRERSAALQREIGRLHDKYRDLTDYRIEMTHKQNDAVPFFRTDDQRSGVIIEAGTSLANLAGAARELSKGTAFMPSGVVRFIMTGIKPLFVRVQSIIERKTGKGSNLINFQITLKIWRPLAKGEMKDLYYKIKAAFGKADKTFLKEKNRQLYELVEKYGGPPQRDRGKFWTMIKREWNAENPKAKYSTANGPRIAYKRILSRIQ
jgi:hypothetical protein